MVPGVCATFTMLWLGLSSSGLVNSARVSRTKFEQVNEHVNTEPSQPDCHKVTANYMCQNLISWVEDANKHFDHQRNPVKMDDVKCAVTLLAKYTLPKCTEALERLIDGGYISDKDITENLPTLKKRAEQKALEASLHVDMTDGAVPTPRCGAGELKLNFEGFEVFTWVEQSDDRTVGAEVEVKCGSKTKVPDAKVRLKCTEREAGPPIWQHIVEHGSCERPTPTCPEMTYELTLGVERNGAKKSATLKFSLPSLESKGVKNMAYPMDCTDAKQGVAARFQERKVVGGKVYFECTTEGKWIIGSKQNDCKFEDSGETWVATDGGKRVVVKSSADHGAELGDDSCEEASYRYSYAGGSKADFSVHELPPTANTRTVEGKCDKSGWSGTVVYICNAGTWEIVDDPHVGQAYCYKPNACLGTEMGLTSGDLGARLVFQLDELAVNKHKDVTCSSADVSPPMSLTGNVRFGCIKGEGKDARPEWTNEDSTCEKVGGSRPSQAGRSKDPAISAASGDGLGPGACERVDAMTFSYKYEDFKSVHELPPTADGDEVKRPCDAEGWSGEVVYQCKGGSWAIKRRDDGKGHCYKPGKCLATSQGLRIGGVVDVTLHFDLKESDVSPEYLEVECGSASKMVPPMDLEGTVKFKCEAGDDGRPSWVGGITSCKKK